MAFFCHFCDLRSMAGLFLLYAVAIGLLYYNKKRWAVALVILALVISIIVLCNHATFEVGIRV
ncbi:MAG: DUF5993 family protein [Simkaniaceae bacterium]